MKFWLLENNCVEFQAKVKEVDFPEITEVIFLTDSHQSILKEWLKKEDMDSLSSTYYFDDERDMYNVDDNDYDYDVDVDVELELDRVKSHNESLKQSLDDAISLLSQTTGFVRDTEIGRRINIYLGIEKGMI